MRFENIIKWISISHWISPYTFLDVDTRFFEILSKNGRKNEGEVFSVLASGSRCTTGRKVRNVVLVVGGFGEYCNGIRNVNYLYMRMSSYINMFNFFT